MYTGKADIYNEQLQTPSYMTYELGCQFIKLLSTKLLLP